MAPWPAFETMALVFAVFALACKSALEIMTDDIKMGHVGYTFHVQVLLARLDYRTYYSTVRTDTEYIIIYSTLW